MKALVVDDDVVSRIALMDLLAAYNVFELEQAEDGEQAWQMLEAGLRPVICFCDVRMPRMSGIDLLQKLKTNPALADMPFVLVSSASDRDTVLTAVKLGAIGYILKPLDADAAKAHLDKIFRLTLDKLAENPVATMKRLNINAARLTAYLVAFQAQLAVGRTEIAVMVDNGDSANAKLRLDTLNTGCVTLGLWHVSSLIEALRARPLQAGHVDATLAEVIDSVERQINRVKSGTVDAAVTTSPA
jgi:two-component system chemotaxis response regulator CheY